MTALPEHRPDPWLPGQEDFLTVAEYADAGIGYYRIVDLDEPLSLAACHLAREFGYQEAPAVTGTFSTQEPFPIRLELDKLR